MRYLPTILIVIAIGYLSLAPQTEVIPNEVVNEFNIDKVFHGLAYMVLALVMYFDYSRQGKRRSRVFAIISAVSATLYGGAIELVQKYLTTYRTGNWYDWLGDAIGAIIALIVLLLLIRYQENRIN